MSNVDAIIAALRTNHDELAAVVTTLSDDDLAKRSGAADWDVAQVLSHLGSGGEIARASVLAAYDGKPNPGLDANQAIWDRWNAMSRREQADGFLVASNAAVELYEAMDGETRENLRIDIGFMPEPVDVALTAGLRLNELVLHSWDVRFTFDPDAVLRSDAAAPLLRQTLLLGWISKPEHLDGKHAVVEVTTTAPDAVFTLNLRDTVGVEFEIPADPDGTLVIPAEAWLRLVSGRLTHDRTPPGITTTGATDLDILRKVFPGY